MNRNLKKKLYRYEYIFNSGEKSVTVVRQARSNIDTCINWILL